MAGSWQVCVSLLLLTLATPICSFSLPPALPLRTSGRFIVDSLGGRVKLVGVNWGGADLNGSVVTGLQRQSLTVVSKWIADSGYNFVRIPLSNSLIETNPLVPSSFLSANPSLIGLRALEVLDAVVQALGQQGILVMLTDMSSDECCIPAGGVDDNGLWWNARYSRQQWIDDWVFLATRYRHVPNVVAADLRNEPHGSTINGAGYWPTWNTHVLETDWKWAATDAGNAILAANPNILIVVEGLPWSKDFSFARNQKDQLSLSVPGHVVYSIHHYPWETDGHTNCTSLQSYLDYEFGFLLTDNISPVIVSEFGTCSIPGMCSPPCWQDCLTHYLNLRDVDITLWLMDGPLKLGDAQGYGLINATWSGPGSLYLTRMLNSMIEPRLTSPQTIPAIAYPQPAPVCSFVDFIPSKPGVNLALQPGAKASMGLCGSACNGTVAIDGQVTGPFVATWCTAGAWWQLDLGAVKQASVIRIFNRMDGVAYRLASATVIVSASNASTPSWWALRYDQLPASQTRILYRLNGDVYQDVVIPPAQRALRYLWVMMEADECLHFYELQLFQECTNIDAPPMGHVVYSFIGANGTFIDGSSTAKLSCRPGYVLQMPGGTVATDYLLTCSNAAWKDAAGKDLTAQLTCVPDTTARKCAAGGENADVLLSCQPGFAIASIAFASYGTPTGTCGSFATSSTCHANMSSSVVASTCVGRQSCTVSATNAVFGDPCGGTVKWLNVQAACKPIDACATNNGGCGPTASSRCFTEAGLPQCACAPGYRGSPPSIPCLKVPSCSPSPCLNGGTCHDFYHNITWCSCAPGYYGNLCELFDAPPANVISVPTGSGNWRYQDWPSSTYLIYAPDASACSNYPVGDCCSGPNGARADPRMCDFNLLRSGNQNTVSRVVLTTPLAADSKKFIKQVQVRLSLLWAYGTTVTANMPSVDISLVTDVYGNNPILMGSWTPGNTSSSSFWGTCTQLDCYRVNEFLTPVRSPAVQLSQARFVMLTLRNRELNLHWPFSALTPNRVWAVKA